MDKAGVGLQLDVFYWIRHDNPSKPFKTKGIKTHKQISAEDLVKQHGVPRRELARYIESEVRVMSALASLPFTLFFLIAYATMVIVHDDAVVIRAVEDSVESLILHNAKFAFDNPYVGHKNVNDVNTLTQLWSWCSKGLVPLLFGPRTSFNYGHNMSVVPRQGLLLNYNRIVGGIRFRQQRTSPQACNGPKELHKFFNGSCAGLSYELDPDSWDARGIPVEENTFWLYVHKNVTELQEELLHMELRGWVDKFTTKLEIGIPLYTAEFGLHSLITINFYFSRGGHIWKAIRGYSSYAQWWQSWYYSIIDAVWIANLPSLLNAEYKDICRTLRTQRGKGCMAIMKDYIGFWNVVDWISIIGGAGICTIWALSISSTDRCNAEAAALGDTAEHVKYSDAFEQRMSQYYDALEDVVHYVHVFKLVLAAYPLVVVLRLFKAFAAQPRLALVTNTIVVAGVDLLHFLLVFTSILFTLAVSGMVLFGRNLEEFTTLPRSANAVFRLMLGDFDWPAIRSAGQAEGALWLFMALCIMNLLMLNVVLAMVMDGYSKVKGASFNADTLFTGALNIWTRWLGVKRKHLVEFTVINKALIAAQEDFMANVQKRIGAETAFDEVEDDMYLGRDTRAVVGMRVRHEDDEIASFVGPGEVVGVGHLVCRVQHGDEERTVREYNIGRDLHYELIYVPGGAKPAALPREEQIHQRLQIYSVEFFSKIVSTHSGQRMRHEQAMDLLTAAAMHYYKAHSEGVNIDKIKVDLRKVSLRMKKIQKVFQGGGGGQTLSLHAAGDMRRLREYLADFYSIVDKDRQRINAEIKQVRADVLDKYERLQLLRPEAAREFALEHHDSREAMAPFSRKFEPPAEPAPSSRTSSRTRRSSRGTFVDSGAGAIPGHEREEWWASDGLSRRSSTVGACAPDRGAGDALPGHEGSVGMAGRSTTPALQSVGDATSVSSGANLDDVFLRHRAGQRLEDLDDDELLAEVDTLLNESAKCRRGAGTHVGNEVSPGSGGHASVAHGGRSNVASVSSLTSSALASLGFSDDVDDFSL